MDWLPEGHLAYFVLEVVRELDLGAIEGAIQKKDPRGERPYAPKMMTSLLLYAYCAGVFSSRKNERATYEDVAFRVILRALVVAASRRRVAAALHDGEHVSTGTPRSPGWALRASAEALRACRPEDDGARVARWLESASERE